MDKRIFDPYDPETGITRYWHYDPATDTAHIETVQNVDPILALNKAAQNESKDHRSEMRHVATIPNYLLMKWKNEDGIDAWNRDHWPAVKRKLNSSEYAFLRTWNCTI